MVKNTHISAAPKPRIVVTLTRTSEPSRWGMLLFFWIDVLLLFLPRGRSPFLFLRSIAVT